MFGMILGLTALTLAGAVLLAPKPQTLLVGYGCEGTDGQPLYRQEEDEFPDCSLIERSGRNFVAVERVR